MNTGTLEKAQTCNSDTVYCLIPSTDSTEATQLIRS